MRPSGSSAGWASAGASSAGALSAGALSSGALSSGVLSLGVLSCLVVVAIARRMNVVDHEGVPIELPLRALAYLPWLLWEIAKSNVAVARLILSPSLPISPRMVKVQAGQRHDIGRVIYANSITLTPGTVTVGVEGDKLTVHALTEEAAESLESGEMDRRVTRAEGAG